MIKNRNKKEVNRQRKIYILFYMTVQKHSYRNHKCNTRSITRYIQNAEIKNGKIFGCKIIYNNVS